MVDDGFQTVDEPSHLFGGDPARAFRGREGIAASRSLPAIGKRTERIDCHPGLEIFNREAGRRFLGVCGEGLGSPRGWVRHWFGVSSRSVHTVILYRNSLNQEGKYCCLYTVVSFWYSRSSIRYSSFRNQLYHHTLTT